ncbi:MAG: type II toxin-antitoxin system RelE/ParE family toxin [Lachnospiraceae bacterium]|nr:type II toxin-antitoxin system RelE/ParE family toxin [Lachnospiraceae bacterium]
MDKFTVDFYTKENGEAPAEDYIRSLDSKMKAKVFRIIDLLEKNGTALRKPYSEHLRNGIYEIRAKQGTDITRVLYFFRSGRRIILTNGFTKKTQKTPGVEIRLAEKYRADYERRFGK